MIALHNCYSITWLIWAVCFHNLCTSSFFTQNYSTLYVWKLAIDKKWWQRQHASMEYDCLFQSLSSEVFVLAAECVPELYLLFVANSHSVATMGVQCWQSQCESWCIMICFLVFFFCHFLLIFALSVAIPRAGLIRFLAPCLLEFEAWQSESLIPYVGDALQASSDGIKDQWGRSVSPGHHPAYRLKTGKLLRKA